MDGWDQFVGRLLWAHVKCMNCSTERDVLVRVERNEKDQRALVVKPTPLDIALSRSFIHHHRGPFDWHLGPHWGFHVIVDGKAL